MDNPDMNLSQWFQSAGCHPEDLRRVRRPLRGVSAVRVTPFLGCPIEQPIILVPRIARTCLTSNEKGFAIGRPCNACRIIPTVAKLGQRNSAQNFCVVGADNLQDGVEAIGTAPWVRLGRRYRRIAGDIGEQSFVGRPSWQLPVSGDARLREGAS